jgi:adenylate cyclase class 2
MLEIEMKFPIADISKLESKFTALPAKEAESISEADHYFNAPDRDFAKTDEALRLRRIGEKSHVTYKGPRTDRHTKTRKEIEVPLGDDPANAEGFMEILTHLGYRPVAVVRKQRRILKLERGGFPVEICLDRVDELGDFVELEIVAGEDKLDAAKATLHSLAAELGLSQAERRSYLELLLQARGEAGR